MQTGSGIARKVLVEGSPLDPVRVCVVDAKGGISEQTAAAGSHEACVHVSAGGWYAMGDHGAGAANTSTWWHAVPSIDTNSVVIIFDMYCPVEDQARVLRSAAELAAGQCKAHAALPRVGGLELGNWIEYDTGKLDRFGEWNDISLLFYWKLVTSRRIGHERTRTEVQMVKIARGQAGGI